MRDGGRRCADMNMMSCCGDDAFRVSPETCDYTLHSLIHKFDTLCNCKDWHIHFPSRHLLPMLECMFKHRLVT